MRIWSYVLAVALIAALGTALVLPGLTSAQQAGKDAAKEPAKEAAKEAPAFKYVGVLACRPCHQAEKNGKVYETWTETSHAKAFEKLGAANQKNEACLACHTTGYGKAMFVGKTAAELQGVQCEACHGPGSDYRALPVMKNLEQAKAKGLIAPTEKVCANCHTASIPKECWAGAKEAPRFSFAVAVKKIEHHVPKKTEPAK